MKTLDSNQNTRPLWLFLLGLQGLLLITGIVIVLTFSTSTPSVESKLLNGNTCAAEAQKAESVGLKVPDELLARCQLLERRASSLQVMRDGLFDTVQTGFFAAILLLVLFIVVEAIILMKLRKKAVHGVDTPL